MNHLRLAIVGAVLVLSVAEPAAAQRMLGVSSAARAQARRIEFADTVARAVRVADNRLAHAAADSDAALNHRRGKFALIGAVSGAALGAAGTSYLRHGLCESDSCRNDLQPVLVVAVFCAGIGALLGLIAAGF